MFHCEHVLDPETARMTDDFVRRNLPPAEQWPLFLFDAPGLRPGARLNACTQLLDRAVDEGHGQRIAVYGEHQAWTYRQLQDHVNRLARLMCESLGVRPGNRVLLRGANSPWLAACWLAVWKVGAVAVGTMPLLRAKELRQIVQRAQVSHALCAQALRSELELAQPDCPSLRQVLLYSDEEFARQLPGPGLDWPAYDSASDDPALIAFTSGTTGVPKGCVHAHRDVLSMCEVFPRHCLKPGSEDIFIGTPPLAFTFGLGGLLCFALHARAATVLLENPTPRKLLEAIQHRGATICVSSPTGYRQLAALGDRQALRSLRKCVSAGEPLNLATRQQWQTVSDAGMYDGVGGTEMMHIYIASGPQDYREGAIGKVLPGYRARLVDEHMRDVAPGETGHLAIRGPTGCRYLADERQTRYVRDGWNITGDTYHADADGYYYYHARVDDMIITSGYNVAGPEVESVLLEHPAVADCAVIGVPDQARGQIVKAFVVLRPEYAPSEQLAAQLQEFVKHNAAPYKYPRALRFVPDLPRTETGKLQRFRLAELS